MEASLTCAVCLALFENPVTLPVCSHNFCRSCVDECLSQASLPALSAVSSSRSAPRSYDPLRTSRRGGDSVSVSCPLCRKLCPLPADLGAAALPVNTTLAELVKLFKAAKPSQGATPEEASSALAPHLAALGVACEKHPGRLMQLYCRMCRRGGCGQCVSEEHRGVFHSVNLIDTVYQEEKLAFFSNLKKIRELHLTLKKEITVPQIDAEKHEKELIETEFEKVHNALEMRKKQLLEDLEIQKTRKEKENLVWKKTKEAHRKTIENVLTDCEKLLDECDPQRFLEVACSLNQRMITQLDLIQLSSDQDESQPECRQMQIDTTSLVKDILALNLTSVNSDAAKGCIKNSCGTFASSIIPCNKTECAHEKTVKATEKNSTAKKSVPLRNDVPFYQEVKDLMCHSSSFSVSEIRNCLKSETDNVLVSQQPVGCDPLANSTSVSSVPTDVSSPLENASAHVEDHRRSPSVTSAASCTVNSDSDVEDLSQASNSSDSRYISSTRYTSHPEQI
ncbi:Tripartite motif-containing protein 3 [Varanus komodoensis]|nr:Tripartite motif-containing protein 3 [Varanus komodoensis]